MKLTPLNTFLVAAYGCLLIYAFIVLLVQSTPAENTLISGYAQVIDGDSIKINGKPIRLWGIDAEEYYEPNGPVARSALIAVIANNLVTCEEAGKRSHNRLVARCYVQGVRDIGAAVVQLGAALDCTRYSGGVYRDLEPPGIRSKLMQKGYC